MTSQALKIYFLVLTSSLLLYACAAQDEGMQVPDTSSAEDSSTPESTGQAGMANPASVYCVEQGGSLEIRTDSDGSQYGICRFADGSECDEWAFFRGECSPGPALLSPSANSQPSYINNEYGFSFNPPAEWTIEQYPDYLLFTRPGYKMFVGYQRADEEPKPFRTGMPSGEFVDGGSATLLGQTVPKQILVDKGNNKVVAYNGRIGVGDLILVVYLDAVETDSISYEDVNIPPEIIIEADQVLASFALTSGETPALKFNP